MSHELSILKMELENVWRDILTVLVTQELNPTTEKAKDNVPKYPNSRLTNTRMENWPRSK
jgi:hypothetical protein